MPEVKRDWKKIIDESNGQLRMAPEQFIPAIKAWDDERKKLAVMANEAAKQELRTRMMLENTVMEIREYLESNGVKRAYLDDVGFEGSALDEGLCVISITKGA